MYYTTNNYKSPSEHSYIRMIRWAVTNMLFIFNYFCNFCICIYLNQMPSMFVHLLSIFKGAVTGHIRDWCVHLAFLRVCLQKRDLDLVTKKIGRKRRESTLWALKLQNQWQQWPNRKGEEGRLFGVKLNLSGSRKLSFKFGLDQSTVAYG